MLLFKHVYHFLSDLLDCHAIRKGRTYTCFWIIFLIGVVTYPQQPCFNVNVARGCVPLTITIDPACADYEPSPNPSATYNYGDTLAGFSYSVVNTVHTYTRPGIYSITQYGQFKGSYNSITRPSIIEVLATPNPVFSTNTCSNYQASVQITDVVYNSYIIEWGDGITEPVSSAGTYQHTYPSETPRTITVSGRYSGLNCGGSASQVVTPKATLPVPSLGSLTTITANSAVLQFQGETGVTYRIERRNENNGTYTQVASQTSSGTGVIEQPLTGPQPAAYRVVRTDACGNLLTSEEISSVVINGTAANNENQISWQAYSIPSFAKSNLLKDSQTILESMLEATDSYNDTAIICGDTSCYQVIVTLSNGARSLSNVSCVRATSSSVPGVIQNLTATIVRSKVILTWDVPTGINAPREYTVYRSNENGVFEGITRISTNRYESNEIRFDMQKLCYRVGYVDNCGNEALISADACPVQLQVTSMADPINEGYRLNWSSYTKWPEGVQTYEVEKLDAETKVLEQQIIGGNEFFFPLDTVHQLLYFRVRAVGQGKISESNIVKIQQDARIMAPDAFSPNGDGVNDLFRIYSLFVRTYKILIYNRWGEVVYASDDKNGGWDGKNKRSAIVMGTYSYSLRIEDQIGRTSTKQGAVLIIN